MWWVSQKRLDMDFKFELDVMQSDAWVSSETPFQAIEFVLN